jgi:spore photoproduct lyase
MYEISKRDSVSPGELLKKAIDNKNLQSTKQSFAYLKNYFLKKRFPRNYENEKGLSLYLPKLSLNDKYAVLKQGPFVLSPKNIFIEKEAKDYNLTKSILKKFPQANHFYIKCLKDYTIFRRSTPQIGAYNLRRDNLFLIKERYDFIKPCPCSKGALGCGYYILNIGFGCPYECSYCFLQGYTNVNGIVIPINIEDFLNRLEMFLKNNKRTTRFGTGEFTDSLALDHLTGFSGILIDFFARTKNAALELKTKSNNVKDILKLKHNRKTIISWSLNPQPIIESDEWQASNLEERLAAAKACCDAGYLVGFHFDPIIYSANWENLYRELVEQLFSKIDSRNIAWISLGAFRFSPKLKTVIEQRFSKNTILDEELLLDFDRKLRYNYGQRADIYKKMFGWIRNYSRSVLVYLCMEPKKMWVDVLGKCRF